MSKLAKKVAVINMTPLQYQKHLRLQEARRLMLVESMDASAAAYHVGYVSRSQFSREYSRLFGAPPLRDVEQIWQQPQPPELCGGYGSRPAV